jgi:alpha-1,3-rhamnosyl/mannosyltransferase
VAGDAALLVDPLSIEALSQGIARLLGDDALCAELIARGKRQVDRFDWRTTAEQTLAVFDAAMQKAIARGHPRPR